MRYLIYLIISLVMQVIALVITPVLPLFAVRRMGWCDNHSYLAEEPRLPNWLSWFDTPDNGLFGDSNFQANHIFTNPYLAKVIWLYRNSLYGFKWSVLAMPIQVEDREVEGDPFIDYHTERFGYLKIKQKNGAWQCKLVTPFLGKILVLNLGWLLDDPSQDKALFMCSPRLK